VEAVTGFANAKLDALLAHASQFRSTMRIEEGDEGGQRAAFEQRIRQRLGEHGALAGVAEGEAFKAIREL
jgi:predicted PhzF superfamily epimerase YddE/YHI9